MQYTKLLIKRADNGCPYYGTDNGAGYKVRKPVCRYGNTKPYKKRVEQGGPADCFVARVEHYERHTHRKGNGGMRRRPTPKDAMLPESKVEVAADIDG